MFVFQWSRLSDYIGRKPVILIGFAGLCISMTCFGLSRTFWALVVRFVCLLPVHPAQTNASLQSESSGDAQREHGCHEEHDWR